MKYLKISCVTILLMTLFLFLPNVVTAESNNNESKTEVTLKKSGKIDKVKPKKEINIYETKQPKEVKLLPKTGEIITTFMYMIIGLSFLLFIMGLLISKVTRNDVRWEY